MSGFGTWDAVRHPNPGPDDDAKPMTRTELAMLWDLLGRWIAGHPEEHRTITVSAVRHLVDAELTERFGS